MTQAVALAQQASTGVSQGFKNRIINGAMVIDQRNAGASVSISASGSFTLDRWGAYANGTGVFSVQQSTTAPVGFTNSCLLTVTTADASVSGTDYYLLRQPIEGYNFADLNFGSANSKTVTISFWVRSSIAGTFGGCLRNSGANYSYPFQYVINATNTWEQKSVTIAGATAGTWLTTNGIGADLWFSIGAGSDYTDPVNVWTTKVGVISANSSTNLISTNGATFYITGVQLEVGSTATSFDYRPYGTELALCQRYFEAGSVWQEGTNAANGNFCVFTSSFLVQKRANATFTYGNVGGANAGVASIQGPEATYEWLSPYDQTNARTGFAFRFVTNNNTSTLRQYWTASAEL